MSLCFAKLCFALLLVDFEGSKAKLCFALLSLFRKSTLLCFARTQNEFCQDSVFFEKILDFLLLKTVLEAFKMHLRLLQDDISTICFIDT